MENKNQSIYEQLGGAKTIDTAVDKFYDKVLADPLVYDFFRETNMKFLRKHQKNFISFVTGGPSVYEGKDLRKVHEHLHLEDVHMDSIKKHLGDTFAELGIKEDLVKKVLDRKSVV